MEEIGFCLFSISVIFFAVFLMINYPLQFFTAMGIWGIILLVDGD